MYVNFNGFTQPIETVAMFLGYTEDEVLLDDSFTVYHEVWRQTAVDGYELDMEIMSQYHRLLQVYPIRVFAPTWSWVQLDQNKGFIGPDCNPDDLPF